MSEMVERVARVRATQACPVAQMKRRQAWVDDNWESYEGQARELIEAMRGIGNDPGPRYAAGEYSRRNVDAMIADALSTQKGEQP